MKIFFLNKLLLASLHFVKRKGKEEESYDLLWNYQEGLVMRSQDAILLWDGYKIWYLTTHDDASRYEIIFFMELWVVERVMIASPHPQTLSYLYILHVWNVHNFSSFYIFSKGLCISTFITIFNNFMIPKHIGTYLPTIGI